MQSDGISKVQTTTVPAYSFTKFNQLPVEIQLRIWCLTARMDEPQTHAIAPMTEEESESYYSESYAYCLRGSSRINCEANRWPKRRRRIPFVLHVCQRSRGVALKIYTHIAARYESGSWPQCEAYFNTLYDSFYMGYEPWNEFKILVDILIKFNTTRPLQTKVQKDMEQLRNIRRLIVDLNIFGAVPAKVWTEFPKLEKLTIAFYAFNTISDTEPRAYERNLVFTKAQRGSKYGKRAQWVVTSAKSALEAAKTDGKFEWKLPVIEALVRRVSNDEVDDFVEEEWTDREVSDEDEADEDADATWYEQAAARMTHNVPKDEFKRLKHRHHPSRQVGCYTSAFSDKGWGDWITDSETEGADHFDRRYISTDDDW